MGEAKRKKNELKGKLITECFGALEPPGPRDAEMLAHISKLRFIEIPHQKNETLHRHGYRMGECHTNAWEFVQRDPKKNSRIATGWMFSRVAYVAHSVVTNTDGGWMCVTPMHQDIGTIWFAEDPLIARVARSAAEQTVMWKDIPCPQKVVIDRERFGRMSQMAIEMLNRGTDPLAVIGKMDEIYEACEIPKFSAALSAGLIT